MYVEIRRLDAFFNVLTSLLGEIEFLTEPGIESDSLASKLQRASYLLPWLLELQVHHQLWLFI